MVDVITTALAESHWTRVTKGKLKWAPKDVHMEEQTSGALIDLTDCIVKASQILISHILVSSTGNNH